MRGRPFAAVCLVFLCIVGIFVGTGVLQDSSGVLEATLLKLSDEGRSKVTGMAYRIEKKETTQVIYLKKVQLEGSKKEKEAAVPVRSCIVYDKSFTDIPIGAKITCTGTISQFEGARNPGNFAQDFYYRKQGIAFSYFADAVTKVDFRKTPYASMLSALGQIKERWNYMLLEKAGEENGGILAAILTGEKSWLDPGMKELYQKNGIGHILAISGLHVSFIGLGIYRMLRRLGISFLTAGGVSSVILLLYMLMVGSSVSVVRAVIMLLIRIGADISGRSYDLPTSLLAAGAVTALWRPLYLKDASFLLSYGAIAGILLMTPVLRMLYRGKRKWLQNFFGGLGLQLFLLPIMLYFYFEFPPYSIVLNLVVIPLLTVVMGGAIAGSAVHILAQLCAAFAPVSNLLGGISTLFLKGCGLILTGYRVLGEVCMKLPGARLVCGKPELWQIFLCYGVFLMLSLVAKRDTMLAVKRDTMQQSGLRICVLCGLIFAVAVCSFPFGRVGEQLRITMVDVGQGDCIYIRTPAGKQILVDGGSTDIKQVGRYRIEPFLLSQGVRRLDYVMVTHGDSDHYSGVEEMLARKETGVEIEMLLLPAVWRANEALTKLAETAQSCGIKVGTIKPELSLEEKRMQLKCLQPGEEHCAWETNEASLVLSLSYGKFSMLLTGDLEGKGEETLCDSGTLRKITVLKTAHHGSEHSTQERFLEQTRPRLALISAGRDNSYGHPHPALLERLASFGVKMYQTPETGAVTIRTDGEKIQIRAFLDVS